MITLRKLASLRDGTRERKYVRLLRTFEEQMLEGGPIPDRVYLRGLFRMISLEENLPEALRNRAGEGEFLLSSSEESGVILRICNGLRHALMAFLEMEPGDWDLLAEGPSGKGSERMGLPILLYLEDIRSPFNVGAIFRSAEALGVRKILISPETASPRHKRAERSAMGAVDMVPWEVLELDELDIPCFALERGGTDIGEFPFPGGDGECCAIIGSEELGVSPRGLAKAESSLGRVSLAMRGLKGSLNVSVATGILLYQWTGRIAGSSGPTL